MLKGQGDPALSLSRAHDVSFDHGARRRRSRNLVRLAAVNTAAVVEPEWGGVAVAKIAQMFRDALAQDDTLYSRPEGRTKDRHISRKARNEARLALLDESVMEYWCDSAGINSALVLSRARRLAETGWEDPDLDRELLI